LGRIAAGRASDMKSVGDAASADMTDPVRNASKREGLASAVPTQALYNSNAYGAMSSVAEYNKKAGVYGAQAIMNEMGGPGASPDVAARATTPGKVYSVQSANADAMGLKNASEATNQSGQAILDKNATAKHARTSGETQAYFDEAGGSVAGVVNLANELGSYGVGKNLAELNANKGIAEDSGISVRSVLNDNADVGAAKLRGAAIAFRASAEKHYGQGQKGMVAMARDFENINNETGVGRNQALRDVAEKHYSGAGNIAAAEKDLQTYNRLKNVADRKEFAQIARKHFGNNDNSEFKMMSVIASAVAARAAGTALSDDQVASRFFGGDKTAMNRAFATYQNLQKGSEINTLGRRANSIAEDKGKFDASQNMAISDYIKTMGVSGSASPALLEKFNSASKSLWNEALSRNLSGKALSPNTQAAIDGIKNNKEALNQFNAVGASIGGSSTIKTAQEARRAEKMTGLEAGSLKEGTTATFKGSMDRSGNIKFARLDGQSGVNVRSDNTISSSTDRGTHHANMAQSILGKKTGALVDSLLAAGKKGPEALQAEITNQAWTLSREITPVYSDQGTTAEGGSTAKGVSAGFNAGLGASASRTVTDSHQKQNAINFNAKKAQAVISTAYSESYGNRERMIDNYNKYVGSFVEGVEGKIEKANPEHYDDKIMENFVSPGTKEKLGQVADELNFRIAKRKYMDETEDNK